MLMEGLCTDWDKESYVQSWRDDDDWNGRAKIQIDLWDGTKKTQI